MANITGSNFVVAHQALQKELESAYAREQEQLAQLTARYFSGRKTSATPGETELVYVTDAHGVFESVEEGPWNEFVRANVDMGDLARPGGPASCMFPAVVGRSLFEFVGDRRVQSFFQHLMLMLSTGTQRRFSYQWYCDSPEYERRMHMTVCRLSGSHGRTQILWVSKTVAEIQQQRRADYLASKPAQIATPEELRASRRRTVCSFCKRILVSMVELREESLLNQLLYETVRQAHPMILPIGSESEAPMLGMRGKLGQHIVATPPSANSDTTLNSSSPALSTSSSSQQQSDTQAHAVTQRQHAWLTPVEYYSQFCETSDSILVNHGICEVCYTEIANSFFPQLVGKPQEHHHAPQTTSNPSTCSPASLTSTPGATNTFAFSMDVDAATTPLSSTSAASSSISASQASSPY